MLDYMGRELIHEQDIEITKTITLDYNKLQAFREKFPALMDADQFTIVKSGQ